MQKIGSSVFSILADETVDIAGNEQLSVSLSTEHKKKGTGYVSSFAQLKSSIAQPIVDTTIFFLSSLGLDCKNIVGQGYDGASVMKSSFNGVQALIKKPYPEALYNHCCSLSLNHAPCYSCTRSIRSKKLYWHSHFLKNSLKIIILCKEK